ncbi:hypothetical protein QUF64_15055 [Anaerolineales bacterium HSG6]|nr:hypothetical protein [Anaerolineales bacterium HSG6]MDM8530165.1 hypothetical protein [Anaerolineales bacterium HSG25]
MHLPIISRPAIVGLPPLHVWPKPVKQVILYCAVIIVSLAYLLLGGGLLALIAVVLEAMSV